MSTRILGSALTFALVLSAAPLAQRQGDAYDDNRNDVPKDAYSTAGNRGQYAVVVPSHDLVIVRRGLDYGRQGFNQWDLVREVIKAVPTGSSVAR
jgi:hypothetical protein